MWQFTAVPDSLKQLLSGEQPPDLEAVLKDSGFMPVLRTSRGMTPLVQFLCGETVLPQLVSIALTSTQQELVMPACTALLKNTNVRKALLSSDVCAKSLSEFVHSDNIRNARLSDRFVAILEDVASGTDMQVLLGQIPDLPALIIKNIEVGTLRQLFWFLASKYSDIIGFNADMMEQVSARAADSAEAGYAVARLVEELADMIPRCPELFTPQVVENLLKVGVDCEDDLTQAQAFKTVEIIFGIFGAGQYMDVVEKHKARFLEKCMKGNAATATGVHVFKTATPEVFAKIADAPPMTILNDGLLKAFQAMTEEERKEIVAKTDLCTRITESWGKTVVNGALVNLVLLLRDIGSGDKWDAVVDQATDRRALWSKSYGVPTFSQLSSDSESDSEEESEDDSDEEEYEEESSDEEEEKEKKPQSQFNFARSVMGVPQPMVVKVRLPQVPAAPPPPPDEEEEDE